MAQLIQEGIEEALRVPKRKWLVTKTTAANGSDQTVMPDKSPAPDHSFEATYSTAPIKEPTQASEAAMNAHQYTWVDLILYKALTTSKRQSLG